jgi:hypothetical protein
MWVVSPISCGPRWKKTVEEGGSHPVVETIFLE